MNTEPSKPTTLHASPPPVQPESAPQTTSKNWRGLGTELKELGKLLVHQLKRPFKPRPIHSYNIKKVESVTPQLNRKTQALNECLKDTAKSIQQQQKGYIDETESNKIAAAYMVMFGLAKYQSSSEGRRTDFSLIPSNNLSSKTRRAQMDRMISGMKWPQMKEFYQNDTLAIPRKAGVLKGTRQLISGQKVRFQNWLSHNKPAEPVLDPQAVARKEQSMSNPKSVYVVVYGDKSPQEAGHAALFIGGKGETSRKPRYVSHLGNGASRMDMVKAALPGIKIDSFGHRFKDDCEQFGMPDFVVELTGLDRDKMIEHLEQSKYKGYDLITHNCSTKVGELLLAGAREPARNTIKKPNGFWTPFDVTAMAQALWKKEQIDNPNFQ